MGEITYPLTNFNGATRQVLEWTSNFILLLIMDIITYACWDWSLFMLVKRVLVIKWMSLKGYKPTLFNCHLQKICNENVLKTWKGKEDYNISFSKLSDFSCYDNIRESKFIWDQHGAHLRPIGPRWAPYWPWTLLFGMAIFAFNFMVSKFF